MEGLSIRRAGPEDLQFLQSLEYSIFPYPWSREMIEAEIHPDPGRIALLALKNEVAVGFAFCWRVNDELHLVNLGVERSHRRQGVAQALLEAILRQKEADGATIMTLEVRQSNQAALDFYTRNSFRSVALRPRYYPDTGEDAVMMLKALTLPASRKPLSDPGEGA